MSSDFHYVLCSCLKVCIFEQPIRCQAGMYYYVDVFLAAYVVQYVVLLVFSTLPCWLVYRRFPVHTMWELVFSQVTWACHYCSEGLLGMVCMCYTVIHKIFVHLNFISKLL